METFQLAYLSPEKSEGEGMFPENKFTRFAYPRDEEGLCLVTDACGARFTQAARTGDSGVTLTSACKGLGDGTCQTFTGACEYAGNIGKIPQSVLLFMFLALALQSAHCNLPLRSVWFCAVLSLHFWDCSVMWSWTLFYWKKTH